MSEAAELHAALLARLRQHAAAPAPILEAFARVPRHPFLPGVPLETAYADDAIVTRDEGGVPTSSSSQPSLMARMLELLELRPGDRVLEVGAGTGYNAALLAALGAAVTSVELQADVAEAARANLRSAGVPQAPAGAGPPPPGTVAVVTGDGAVPPAGPYDRVVVTASCWQLPAALAEALAPGGVLVAPLRINGVEIVARLRREGERLCGRGGIHCGFMPLRGGAERPWRWPLGTGGTATADADLGDEGRGALDRLLATPALPVRDPLELRRGEHALDAALWLGLQGDPLLGLLLPDEGTRRVWRAGLHVLPASLLVLQLAPGLHAVEFARLHGGDAALRACTAAVASWRAAGAPGTDRLELTIEPARDRTGASLPWREPDGSATLVRGAHRWRLRYGAP